MGYKVTGLKGSTSSKESKEQRKARAIAFFTARSPIADKGTLGGERAKQAVAAGKATQYRCPICHGTHGTPKKGSHVGWDVDLLADKTHVLTGKDSKEFFLSDTCYAKYFVANATSV